MMTRSTVTITTFALVSAILAVGIMIAVGSAAYALGGPGGSGGRCLSSVVAAVTAPWKRQISRAGHRRPGAEDALP